LFSASLAACLVDLGDLVEADAIASPTLRELEAAGDVTVVPAAELVLARIASLRGDAQAALEWVKRLSSADVLSARLSTESTMARILADAGDHEAARRLLADILDPTLSQSGSGEDLRDAVPAAVAIGDLEVAERLLDRALPPWPHLQYQSIAGRARVAEARAAYDEAVAGHAEAGDWWAAFGSLPDEADARLGLGRCMVVLGRLEDATPALERARALYERMGARPGVAEADALLAVIADGVAR